MYKFFIWCSISLIIPLQNIFAQQISLGADAFGFFDNQEFKNPNRKSQTMDGFWINPNISVSWEQKHTLRFGYGARTNWGDKKTLQGGTITLYYQYTVPKGIFTIGSFPREALFTKFPTALICDSVRYYDPNMEGILLQCHSNKGYAEAFLDWTGCRSREVNEQFMTGIAANLGMGHTNIGIQGYYYHYALTEGNVSKSDVTDYAICNVYAGYDLSKFLSMDSATIQGGLLLGVERNRAEIKKWYITPGFLNEIAIMKGKLNIKNTFYYGKSQQVNGDAGNGKWYWNDACFRSSLYDRLDASWRIINSKNVRSYAGVVLHSDGHHIDMQQRLSVRISLRLSKPVY